MDKLERKLNSLPQYRLSRRADLLIRKRIFFALLEKHIAAWRLQLSVPRLMRPVAAVCGLTLVFSLPVYAYASPGVHLGHPLYPVKANLEQLEGLLVDDSGEAAVYYAKLSERRLAEAEKIAVKGEDTENLKATIRAARRNNEISQAEAAGAGTTSKPELAEKLLIKREEQKTILIEVARQVGIARDEELTDTIAAALEEVKKAPGQAKKHERFLNNFPSVTDSRPEEQKASPTPGVLIEQNNDGDRDNEDLTDRKAASTSPATSTSTQPNNSAAEKKQKDREKKQEKKKPVRSEEAMNQVQTRIQELKGRLKDDDDYDEEQLDRLFERLDKKVSEAQTKLDDQDLPAAEGLLNATEALTNNAKHFLKSKDINEDRKNNRGKKRNHEED